MAVRHEQRRELALDDALAASFPASDPPAWNPGLARPGPVGALQGRMLGVRPDAARDDNVTAPAASGGYGSERTLLEALVSLAGAVGIALLVPFVIVLVGLPIALGARGLLEVFLWLLPAIR